jgi:hypothetical protein
VPQRGLPYRTLQYCWFVVLLGYCCCTADVGFIGSVHSAPHVSSHCVNKTSSGTSLAAREAHKMQACHTEHILNSRHLLSILLQQQPQPQEQLHPPTLRKPPTCRHQQKWWDRGGDSSRLVQSSRRPALARPASGTSTAGVIPTHIWSCTGKPSVTQHARKYNVKSDPVQTALTVADQLSQTSQSEALRNACICGMHSQHGTSHNSWHCCTLCANQVSMHHYSCCPLYVPALHLKHFHIQTTGSHPMALGSRMAQAVFTVAPRRQC